MAGRLHIPSLEEMDQVKQPEVSSHFKSSRMSSSSSVLNNVNISLSSSASSTSTITTSHIQSYSTHHNVNTSTTSNTVVPSTSKYHASTAAIKTTGKKKLQSFAQASASASVDSVVPSIRQDDQLSLVCSSGSVPSVNVTTVVAKSSTETPSTSEGPTRQQKQNAIIVNNRQKGNPILKFVRKVPWEFGDIIPDYQIGPSSCVLYLSLRYHNLNPNYIHERLKLLANTFNLRVLLVQVDVKDPDHNLKELAAMCIMADCTLMLAFTPEEAGRYLETYKAYENKPPDLIMEKTETNFLAKFTDTLTSVKKINKTDSMSLLTAFGSFEKICAANEEDLSLCPGVGPQKAQRLHKVLHQPFLRESRKT